ncbi:unnamed protein product [Schistosoma intercalatum]|nr:unnamed protein product [Schistosoma intercalatum]CAH8612902.1 unnamed protein product [Schistosoma intercalatum]
MKTHVNLLRSPRSNISDCSPYVLIIDSLAATKDNLVLVVCCLRERWSRMMLISAPVSTKKSEPEIRSLMWKRRLTCWPVTAAAITVWPLRFPDGLACLL